MIWFITDDIFDAFNKHKEEKEKLIQEVVEPYKDKIPQDLYYAMMNWGNMTIKYCFGL